MFAGFGAELCQEVFSTFEILYIMFICVLLIHSGKGTVRIGCEFSYLTGHILFEIVLDANLLILAELFSISNRVFIVLAKMLSWYESIKLLSLCCKRTNPKPRTQGNLNSDLSFHVIKCLYIGLYRCLCADFLGRAKFTRMLSSLIARILLEKSLSLLQWRNFDKDDIFWDISNSAYEIGLVCGQATPHQPSPLFLRKHVVLWYHSKAADYEPCPLSMSP